MLNPIFSRHHRRPGAYDIPPTPTNEQRVQRFRAIAPVQLWNTRFSFNPRRQSEAAAARGALADGDFLYGGGEMQPKRNGESDTERVRAQVAGKSAAASTQSPQRAIPSPQPAPAGPPQAGTYTHTPGD